MKRGLIWSFATTLALGATPLLAGEKHQEEHEHTSMKFEDLPAPVQKTFRHEAQGGQVENVRKETEDGQVVYEGKIVKSGREHELEVSADGKVLERGKADDAPGTGQNM
jgi:uncharacterized membrane protein YkoI